MSVVKDFSLQGESGVVVLDRDYLKWLKTHKSSELGPKIVAYKWIVDDQQIQFSVDASFVTLHELPDLSGFICFEKPWVPNNCLLLDAYGRERMRLTVPWELTKPQNPKSAHPPTSFALLSEPYINPADGKEGKFGVTAWVEHAGRYYFELENFFGAEKSGIDMPVFLSRRHHIAL